MTVYTPISYCAELNLVVKGKLTWKVADTLQYRLSIRNKDVTYPHLPDFNVQSDMCLIEPCLMMAAAAAAVAVVAAAAVVVAAAAAAAAVVVAAEVVVIIVVTE